jgi:hypothetical protein
VPRVVRLFTFVLGFSCAIKSPWGSRTGKAPSVHFAAGAWRWAVTILARRPTDGAIDPQPKIVAALSPTALAVSLSAGSTQGLCTSAVGASVQGKSVAMSANGFHGDLVDGVRESRPKNVPDPHSSSRSTSEAGAPVLERWASRHEVSTQGRRRQAEGGPGAGESEGMRSEEAKGYRACLFDRGYRP